MKKKKFTQTSSSNTIQRVSHEVFNLINDLPLTQKRVNEIKKLLINYPKIINQKILSSYKSPNGMLCERIGSMLSALIGTHNSIYNHNASYQYDDNSESFNLIFDLIKYMVNLGSNVNVTQKIIFIQKNSKKTTIEKSLLAFSIQNPMPKLYLFLLEKGARLKEEEYNAIAQQINISNNIEEKKLLTQFLENYEPFREKLLLEKKLESNNIQPTNSKLKL